MGSEIVCEYTFSDSGNIEIKITIPSVGITEVKDSYDRLSGQIDFNHDAEKVLNEAQEILDKLEELTENQFDVKLNEAKEQIYTYLDRGDELTAEELQALFELVQASKGVIADFMQQNRSTVWQEKLNSIVKDYSAFSKNATPVIAKQFNNLRENAQRAIDANSPTAETLLQQLYELFVTVMFSNDETYLAIFADMAQNPQDFTNPALYRQLINQGMQCVQKNDISELKNIVSRLAQIMVRREGSAIDKMLRSTGITK